MSELAGSIGLFYIGLLILGIAFVWLEQAQHRDGAAELARTPHAALFQALHPLDNGL